MKKTIFEIQGKTRKAAVIVLPAVATFAAAVPAYAAEVDVNSVMTTAFNSVKSDMMGSIAAALPIALAVVGAVMAVKFGIKFFRQVAK